MLKQFIEQLSADIGFEQSLAPNEDGSYSLHLEPDLHISLRENPESGITLYTVTVLLPEENTEAFLLKIMAANLFGRETGGSTLGLNKEGKRVVLLNFLPQQLTYREFHDYLEDFVNYAESWRVETIEFVKQEGKI